MDIELYLNNIYDDFKEYIYSNTLCDLKCIDFGSSALPDYNNVHVQQLYLLRYAFAYAFEYKWIFAKQLPEHKLFGDPDISILSIGCGSCLDYWGAINAITKKRLQSKVKYFGVDKVAWNYVFSARKQDSLDFYKGDIVEYLEENAVLDYNFIVFPKSISEFDKEIFRKICSSIRRIKFSQKHIVLLVSLRNNSNNCLSDLSRVDELVAAFKANKHHEYAFRNYEKGKCFAVGDEGIRAYDSSFVYPQDIYNFLNSLMMNCSKYIKRGVSCNNCERLLNRRPILRATQIKYVAIHIYRKEI